MAQLLAVAAALAAVLGVAELGPVLGRGYRGLELEGSRRGGPAIRALAARLVESAGAFPALAGAPRSATLAGRLAAAGEPGRLEPSGWLRFKLGCAALAALVGLPAVADAPGRLAPLLLLAAPAAGFAAPELWLSRRSRQRIVEALAELPDMLDLLRVTVEAGMAPARALGEVGRQFDGILALEWRSVAAEVVLGAPQDEAVRALVRKLPAEEVAALVDALTRTRRHGVPLSEALGAQASRARHRRAQQVRERAARAGPKIQLVVALLLVPSVLLLVAAALVAELARGGLLPVS